MRIAAAMCYQVTPREQAIRTGLIVGALGVAYWGLSELESWGKFADRSRVLFLPVSLQQVRTAL
jgi:hypothetical protein